MRRQGASFDLLFASVLVLTLLAAFLPREAGAVDRTFAGSAQLDYNFVPDRVKDTGSTNTSDTFEGFTIEAAVKVAADISEHVSANVKLCYGCHGFEADMAYFDLRAADEFNVRIGRFSPTFGSFNLRHDPANHKLSDKPLVYDMGRMLRRTAWNNGVLPAPFPDNGVEVNGTHWFGESVQLDYAAYAVSGFKQSGPNPTDLNFQESHLIYYVDNNARPSGGGRLALTAKLGAMSDMTLGGSAMAGTYDPANRLLYAIGGADFALRIDRFNFRAEYLLRRQEFETSVPSLFTYAVAPNQGDFFVKQGGYAEIEQGLGRTVDAIVRLDGMLHTGNTLATSGLRDKSSVVRETLGVAIALEKNLRLKVSGELWEWSDDDAEGRQSELSFHLGAVGSF